MNRFRKLPKKRISQISTGNEVSRAGDSLRPSPNMKFRSRVHNLSLNESPKKERETSTTKKALDLLKQIKENLTAFDTASSLTSKKEAKKPK